MLDNFRLGIITKPYGQLHLLKKQYKVSVDGSWDKFGSRVNDKDYYTYACNRLRRDFTKLHLGRAINEAVKIINDDAYEVYVRAKPGSKKYNYLLSIGYHDEQA